MTFTLIDLIEILIPAAIAIIGWIVASRKSSAEVDHLEAETAGLYADIATKSAQRERDSLANEIILKEQIKRLENRINVMSETIASLMQIVQEKDGRIAELEKLSKSQATKIIELQAEIDTLRMKRSTDNIEK